MSIPDFQSLMLPLLKLASSDSENTLANAIEELAREFRLSEAERAELLPSGRQPRFNNRVGWAATYLKKAGLLRPVRRGVFEITERGRTLLAEAPPKIDLKLLEGGFPEVLEFRGAGAETPASFNVDEGAWTLRPAVAERVRRKLEDSIPDDTIRHGVLSLLAFAIENADDERGDAWRVRERRTVSGSLRVGSSLARSAGGSRRSR